MPTAATAEVKSRGDAHYNFGYIWTISLVAALGGLLFGYDWVVIGGAKQFFEPFFGINGSSELAWDSWISGWANSCALVGCLMGSIAGGALSDRFGRKWLLSASAILFVVTSIGNALAGNFETFIAWRILGGTAIGLASNLSPLYISEIAPAGMRGRLVSINQLTIVIGILLAQFINWWLGRNLPEGVSDAWIRDSWYGTDCWRWMFGLTAAPSALFFLGMFCVPESPRWLVKNGRPEPARKTLSRIGGEGYAAAALAEIESTLVHETEKVRFRELLDPRMTRVLLLGVTLAVFQQWCGINVIFNYAKDIFKDAGYDIADVLKNIAWTGSVNLIFTLLALRFIDRSGRRPLMLFGAAGLALIYIGLGCGYAVAWKGWPMLVLVLAAMGCYGMSLAPVTWVVIAEIFPNRIRGAAMAVAVSALWIACFLLTCTFPLLKKALGPAGAFWLYAAICVAGFFYILWRLPETKGKTLEEIEKELVD